MATKIDKTTPVPGSIPPPTSPPPPPPPRETPPPQAMTLQQKFVELRKAVPHIAKEQHSDGVPYRFAKIDAIWEAITPVMNEIGVNFDVASEVPTRFDEGGNPIYFTTMQTMTRNGEKLMFTYEADLTLRWINTDDDDDREEVTLHAVAWNDDPAKAKGSAWTYCIKYYLFEKLSIDLGEDDPDNNDMGAQSGKQQPTGGARRLSEKQLNRMYMIGKRARLSEQKINGRILEKYGKEDPATLTRKEYDEICEALESAADNEPAQ